jgi:hypothetical protein
MIGICSVADPECLSRILVYINPGFRIPNSVSHNSRKEEKEKNCRSSQKIVTKLSTICVWDPRTGIRDMGSRKKPSPDPGDRKALDPGSRIRIRNTGHLFPNPSRTIKNVGYRYRTGTVHKLSEPTQRCGAV